MWKCRKCNELLEDQFEVCWNCGARRDGSEAHDLQAADEPPMSRQSSQSVVDETAPRERTMTSSGGGGATADLHCVRCGYHLRGLAEDGTCPECGTAVARSKRGDLLSAADPAWLRRIYRGHLYIVIGCAVYLLNLPLYWMSGTLMPTYFFMVSGVVVPLLFLGIVLVGVVLVTTLDPRLSLTEQPVGLRRITRGAAIGALGVASLRLGMRLSGAAGSYVPIVGWGRKGDRLLYGYKRAIVVSKVACPLLTAFDRSPMPSAQCPMPLFTHFLSQIPP